MLTRKYFPCPSTVKTSLKNFSIRCQILPIKFNFIFIRGQLFGIDDIFSVGFVKFPNINISRTLIFFVENLRSYCSNFVEKL